MSSANLYNAWQYITKETGGRHQKLELYIGPDNIGTNPFGYKEIRPPYPFHPTLVPYSDELTNPSDGTLTYPEYSGSQTPDNVNHEIESNLVSLSSFSTEQSRQLGVLFSSITTLWVFIDGSFYMDVTTLENFQAVFPLLEMVGKNLVDFRMSVTPRLLYENIGTTSQLFYSIMIRFSALLNGTMVKLKTLSLFFNNPIARGQLPIDLPVLSHIDVFSIDCLPFNGLIDSLLQYVQPRVLAGALFQFYCGNLCILNPASTISQLDGAFLASCFKEYACILRNPSPRLPFSSLRCLTLKIGSINPDNRPITWTELITSLQPMAQSLQHLFLNYFDLEMLVCWSGEVSGRLMPPARPFTSLQSITLGILESDRLDNHFVFDKFCTELQVLAPALQVIHLIDGDLPSKLIPCTLCHRRTVSTSRNRHCDCLEWLLYPLQFLTNLRYIRYTSRNANKSEWSKQQLQQLSTNGR